MRRNVHRRWTDEETAFLAGNYRALGARQCAERLNRTLQQVYDKARAMRISTERAWDRPPAGRVAAPRGPAAVKVPAEPPKPSAVYDSGFIKAPSLARLMAGKA